MNLKMTSAALAGVAVLLMIAVQFLPWLTVERSGTNPGFQGFGVNVPSTDYETTTDANTWDVDVTTTTNGGNEQTSDKGWYDNDWDDSDGIGTMRTGIPMLAAASLVVLVGAVLAMLGSRAGNVVTLVGGVLLVAATVVFAIGLNVFFDDVAYDWSLSFYFAIAACACALGSSVTGFLATQRTGTATY